MNGFKLKVSQNGLILLTLEKPRSPSEKKPKTVTPLLQAISFSCPNEDGDRFNRCLEALRLDDVIEVRFLHFLPKEA